MSSESKGAVDSTWFRPGTGEMFDLSSVARSVYDEVGKEFDSIHARKKEFQRTSYRMSRDLFLRLMSLCFLSAFGSLFYQIQGLLGSHGMIPISQNQGGQSDSPLSSFAHHSSWVGDAVLDLLCIAGVGSSVAGVAFSPSFYSLFGSWLIYLVLCSAGVSLLSYDADKLLLESGFVACLMAPLWIRERRRDSDNVLLLLIRFVLFKFLILSAMNKVTSGYKEWFDLTAIEFSFATNIVPTPAVWYLQLLPSFMFQLAAGFQLIVELLLSFFIFSPFSSVRHASVLAILITQLATAVFSNEGFFFMLKVCLLVPVVDDSLWSELLSKSRSSSAESAEETPLIDFALPFYGTETPKAEEEEEEEEKERTGWFAGVFKFFDGIVEIGDRMNDSKFLQLPIFWSHVAFVLIIVLFFMFRVDWDGESSKSWIVISPTVEQMITFLNVVVPVTMLVLLVVYIFLALHDVLKEGMVIVDQLSDGHGKRQTVTASLSLLVRVLICFIGLLLIYANRVAIGSGLARSNSTFLTERTGAQEATGLVAPNGLQSRYEGKKEEKEKRWPAVTRALHDRHLPWGKMFSDVQNLEEAIGSNPTLQEGKEEVEEAWGRSWAGMAFRLLQPLRIVNIYWEGRGGGGGGGEKEGRKGGSRTEVVLEVSSDPECEGGAGNWTQLDVYYQVGRRDRPPGWSLFLLPRLELKLLELIEVGDWREASWLVNLLAAILAGQNANFFRSSIFPHDSKCVRASKVQLVLSSSRPAAAYWEEAQRSTKVESDWWEVEVQETFVPIVSPAMLACTPFPSCLPAAEDSSSTSSGRRRLLATSAMSPAAPSARAQLETSRGADKLGEALSSLGKLTRSFTSGMHVGGEETDATHQALLHTSAPRGRRVPSFLRGDAMVVVVLLLAAWIFVKLSSFIDWEEVVDALVDKQSRDLGFSFAALSLVAVISLIMAELWSLYPLAIFIVAAAGCVVSIYLHEVDRQVEFYGESYQAACDISNTVSCSSSVKKGSNSMFLGITNSSAGIVYYLVVAFCVLIKIFTDQYWPIVLAFILTAIGVVYSLYLLYFSLSVLRVLCPLCAYVHIFNFILFWIMVDFAEELRWQ
ncbi:hypothetical protein GUITHDRAFT_99399 [Guillardia theta CCMP2712]|uniref:Vitamin K epoxide reductase domain-containing protein n=2 Tax=Guillardia theta TaxID=55529 RepID=L1K2D5_GUITC|nr:hypothetical protein GUITHDRAFT_99399 [Guillardia theta CCMP2712]EKX54744.1 hypothetical protein GUITHDRAFT_99399 [Guillardia theta CCMP2712]|eukprot:XP_005841724.1 hypothetical protein GUITHDRAFT_99399 [Guillardia theta CCMP2712]